MFTLIVALFLTSCVWYRTQRASLLKTWVLLVQLMGAVVLSALAGPLDSVGQIWVNLAAVGLGAIGGSVPAAFFVGKLQPRIQRETRDYQTVAGRLGFMRFRATVSSYQDQDEPDGGGRLIGVFERLAVVLCLLTAQTNLLAVIVAIKGLARYSDIKSGHLTAEKFIVGTFTSLLWAAGCALIAINLS